MQMNFMLIVVSIMSLTSCTKGDEQTQGDHDGSGGHGTPANWKFSLPQGNATDGRKLFVEAECHKCHEIKGETFPSVAKEKGDVGPDLSQMAGLHSPEFFAESIINPNAVIDRNANKLGYVGEDGKSKMPAYNSVLTRRRCSTTDPSKWERSSWCAGW